MWIGFGYKGAAFTDTNSTLYYFDLTDGGYEVIATDKNMGTRANTLDTDGVISYVKGEAEEFKVNYYKFGNYKLGPLSVEDDDASIVEIVIKFLLYHNPFPAHSYCDIMISLLWFGQKKKPTSGFFIHFTFLILNSSFKIIQIF